MCDIRNEVTQMFICLIEWDICIFRKSSKKGGSQTLQSRDKIGEN